MDECEEKREAMGGEGGRPVLFLGCVKLECHKRSKQKKNVRNKKMISLMMICFFKLSISML